MESNAKNNPMPNMNDIPDALFTRAEFHEELSEEAGFSNYSYWRSTIRTFFKSTVVKVIVALLIALVAYTVIYPMVTDRDPYAVALSAREPAALCRASLRHGWRWARYMGAGMVRHAHVAAAFAGGRFL